MDRRILSLMVALALGAGSPVPAGAQPAGPIFLVFFEDYPPMSYRENGVMKGIFIDIVREVFEKKLNLKVRVEGYPWARAQLLVRTGGANGFVTVPIEERREYTEVTQPSVLKINTTLYTGAANPEKDAALAVTTLAEARHFSVASYIGDAWTKQNVNGAKVIWTTGMDDVLTMLQSTRPFIALDSELVFDWLIKTKNLKSKVLKGHSVDLSPVNICIGKKSPFLGMVPQINRVLQDLVTSGRFDQIMEAYR